MKPLRRSMTGGFSADAAQVIDSRTGLIRYRTGPPVDERVRATWSRALTRQSSSCFENAPPVVPPPGATVTGRWCTALARDVWPQLRAATSGTLRHGLSSTTFGPAPPSLLAPVSLEDASSPLGAARSAADEAARSRRRAQSDYEAGPRRGRPGTEQDLSSGSVLRSVADGICCQRDRA